MRKFKTIIVVFGVILLAGFLLVNFGRQIYVVPILMYHSINPQQNPDLKALIVSPAGFQRQMRFLKNNRYNVLPLEALADLIKQKKKIPPRTVAITFDDGYKDTYKYAFPALREYNLPAFFFIIVNEVSRPQNDRLSWEELKSMRDSGIISFGSHCMGPEPLVNINSEEIIRKEIFDSKKLLENRLGVLIQAFSYPEGLFNRRIKQLVQEAGYKFAVATRSRSDNKIPNNDIFALKRLRISSGCDNLFVFWFKLSGFYTFFKEARK